MELQNYQVNIMVNMSVYIAKSRQQFDITFNNLFVERSKSRFKRIIYAYNMNTSYYRGAERFY